MYNPFARASQGSLLGILGALGQGQNPFAGINAPSGNNPAPHAPQAPNIPAQEQPLFDAAKLPVPDARRLAYRKGIQSIESGGKYTALGPMTDSGDRAYGAYQIMGANIPQWTKEALGVALTPAQFLRNQAAQDATFDHRFGQYVAKHGEQNAAQAWFGGEGSIGQTGRQDMLGTSVGDYGKRFMAALSAPTPFTYANEKGNVDPAYTRALTTPLPLTGGFAGLDRPTRDGTEGLALGAGPTSRGGFKLTSQPVQQAQAQDPTVPPPVDYGEQDVANATQSVLAQAKQGSQRAMMRKEALKRRMSGAA